MRKIIACLVLLIYLAAWIALAATIGSNLPTQSRWLQLLFYILAGTAWVIPVKPLFAWMNRGEKVEEE